MVIGVSGRGYFELRTHAPGCWYRVKGTTYPIRDLFKRNGFVWNRDWKSWDNHLEDEVDFEHFSKVLRELIKLGKVVHRPSGEEFVFEITEKNIDLFLEYVWCNVVVKMMYRNSIKTKDKKLRKRFNELYEIYEEKAFEIAEKIREVSK